MDEATSRSFLMKYASSLLHQLHYHLQECYGANSVGLHVRISNKAAVRLYCDDGYDVADIIPMYYGDGEDAYFMRKDLDIASSMSDRQVESQQQQQQQRQWRRGERERNEWLNRDARAGGSFFDNRKSIRDTLAEDERAWVNNGNRDNPPSIPGQFKRSFRTFFNGGEHNQQFRLPPWEVGPEELRLPRYRRVLRKEDAIDTTGVSNLKDLVARLEEDHEDDGDIESYGSYEEEIEDSYALESV